jgi:hypothetical protein
MVYILKGEAFWLLRMAEVSSLNERENVPPRLDLMSTMAHDESTPICRNWCSSATWLCSSGG